MPKQTQEMLWGEFLLAILSSISIILSEIKPIYALKFSIHMYMGFFQWVNKFPNNLLQNQFIKIEKKIEFLILKKMWKTYIGWRWWFLFDYQISTPGWKFNLALVIDIANANSLVKLCIIHVELAGFSHRCYVHC